jgi:endoglucanase
MSLTARPLRRRSLARLAAATALAAVPAGFPGVVRAQRPPPAVLARGLNITNWFRFPAQATPAGLRAYMPDAAMREIAAAGFTFIRLCIQPQILLREDGSLEPGRLGAVLDGIERLQRAGLAVIVDAHPETWRPEQRPSEGRALIDFWKGMAPHLAAFDPGRCFVEVMNEPIFDDHRAWATLQLEALRHIRAVLPRHMVVLTGADWGSIAGLLRLPPVDDPNVVYSVHDYTPGILSHMATWENGHDRQALARLPFPVGSAAACAADTRRHPNERTRALAAFYCSEGWNEEKVRQHLGQAAAWGARHAAPVLLLEFGAHAEVNAPARNAYIAAMRRAAEHHRMGWALWGYGDIMGFPASSGPAPARLDRDLIAALGLRG